MTSKKVSVSPRWSGPIPTRKDGTPLPKNQWGRAGRKRAWLVRWFDLDGKRPCKTFRSREEADAFALAKTVEFEEHGPTARVQIQHRTLAQYADEFEQMRTGPRGQRLAARTARDYLTVFREFAAGVGESTLLESITPADVTRHIAALRARKSRFGKGLSAHSINKHKRCLQTVFSTAVSPLGYIRQNPCSLVKQDKLADTDVRYVTTTEFGAIREACGERVWWQAFTMLCYTAGTRANEAVHLIWRDVDFDDSTIRIAAKPDSKHTIAWQPKSRKNRYIPIPETTVALLARMQSEAPSGSAYVFVPTERIEYAKQLQARGQWPEDRPIVNNLTRNFKRFASAAGVSDVSLHDLRRSAITHWARRLPVHVVKDLAGHANIQTTLRYYITVQQSDREQARRAIADIMAETGA